MHHYSVSFCDQKDERTLILSARCGGEATGSATDLSKLSIQSLLNVKKPSVLALTGELGCVTVPPGLNLSCGLFLPHAWSKAHH